jgi:hypothetical protein
VASDGFANCTASGRDLEADPPFDFATIAADLNRLGIRWLLFGRQAVVLYGAPVSSADWDLWADPAQRAAILGYFKSLHYETSADATDVAPIVKIRAGLDRIDLFLMRAMVNREGRQIDFDQTFARAGIVTERFDQSDAIRVPAIDDLIALKKMGAKVRPKDEEDIRYLQVRQAMGLTDPT